MNHKILKLKELNYESFLKGNFIYITSNNELQLKRKSKTYYKRAKHALYDITIFYLKMLFLEIKGKVFLCVATTCRRYCFCSSFRVVDALKPVMSATPLSATSLTVCKLFTTVDFSCLFFFCISTKLAANCLSLKSK